MKFNKSLILVLLLASVQSIQLDHRARGPASVSQAGGPVVDKMIDDQCDKEVAQ